MTWFLIGFGIWVLFNWLAPWAVVLTAERMNIGSIPGEILVRANANHVRFYRATLAGGFAFTVWSWPAKIVVLDREFLRVARPEIIRFVLAHELGHIALGHTFKKWLAMVFLVGLIPAVRRRLQAHEGDADKYAEDLSGVPSTVLWGNQK